MADADADYDPAAEEVHWGHVTAVHPGDAAAWFNLGLARKYLRDWAGCAEANHRSLEIEAPAEDPAWWNLGIAATALRDWELARRAWRGYGIDRAMLPDGTGPIEVDWGRAPVRIVGPGEEQEVVWGRRICPARIKIENVPFPSSGHRWGDVVLHDGAPNGERVVDGRVYGVFDELERWSPSEIPTLDVAARCERDADAEALIEAFEAAHFSAEDCTANVRSLCAACSAGNLCSDAHAFPTAGIARRFGIAAPLGLAGTVLHAWRSARPATRDFDEPVVAG
jgi:hypothetical protein